MEGRKPFTRWTRPAPGRELPRACVAPWHPEGEDDRMARLCPDGCVPGGCCLAVGWDASSPAGWWRRGLTGDEEAAVESARLGSADAEDLGTVADLADECWRAGCPLENPDAASRRGADVPGCPGFCDALPADAAMRPRWELVGWKRALTPREKAALRRSVVGGWTADDRRVVEALCEECEECGCAAGMRQLVTRHMTRDELPCPGFCVMAPPRMFDDRGW